MILGLGTDIIEVSRVKKLIDEYASQFLNRIFTDKERLYCGKYDKCERHYAGRYAAKEAIVKAIGTGFGKDASFLDIEILNDDAGKPIVYLSGKLQEFVKGATVELSISHCHEYATAVAILMQKL